MELYYKTISELESLLDKGEISAVELAEAFIGRKNAVDDRVGAFLSSDDEGLLAAAAESYARSARG